MKITDILDGCLDAGNLAGAAAAVLAHPISTNIDRVSISKLFDIAYKGAEVRPVDGAFIRVLGEIVRQSESLARQLEREARL